jgi:hypothetical protein
MSYQLHVFFVSMHFSKTLQVVSQISSDSLNRVLSVPAIANDTQLMLYTAQVKGLCLPFTLKIMESFQSPMAYLAIRWTRVVIGVEKKHATVDFGSKEDMEQHFDKEACQGRYGEINLSDALSNLLFLYKNFLDRLTAKTEALVNQLANALSEETLPENHRNLILEQLQFQDRVRQILENLHKMILLWSEKVCSVYLKGEEPTLTRKNLAQLYLGRTTTAEERVLLQELEPELEITVEKSADDDFFL